MTNMLANLAVQTWLEARGAFNAVRGCEF